MLNPAAYHVALLRQTFHLGILRAGGSQTELIFGHFLLVFTFFHHTQSFRPYKWAWLHKRTLREGGGPGRGVWDRAMILFFM